MNAIPIKTWIDDPSDTELESLWHLLEKLSVVDDVPKVISEIKNRNWELDHSSVHKLIESEFIPATRGVFNSPVHRTGKTEFVFEDV